jgi:GLPGLI family protein
VIQKANEIKYSIELDLFYNNNESLYFSEQKLSIKNSLEEEFARITVGANLIRYKNNTKREKFYQIDESGQKFNVILNFDEYKWEITTESKIINGYKCFKAISYKEEFDKIRNRKNVFHPVVWFTPEIPSSFGPEGFDGLPGLVLEASRNGRAFLFATKIEFDYKGTIQIRKPQKGKDVTEIEYLQIIADLFPKN